MRVPEHLDIMNSTEAAEYLHISKDLLLSLCRKGAIRCVPIRSGDDDDTNGKRSSYHYKYLFSKQSLNEWFVRTEELYSKKSL